MKLSRRALRFFSLLPFAVLLLTACEPAVRDRPYGELRLGLVRDLLAPQTFLDSAGLLIRHDAGGLSAMSTLCTKDVSVLVRKPGAGGEALASKFTASTYDLDGRVLTGPAVKNLPYFELYIAQGKFGGAADTLYARIGNEKPKEWRLPVPPTFLSPQ